jgi:Tfp pilus tip-associated adhesin PilY1
MSDSSRRRSSAARFWRTSATVPASGIAHTPSWARTQASATRAGLIRYRLATPRTTASGCESDGNRFLDYLYTLFDNQPPEESAGLSDEELAQLGAQAGLSENLARCVM